MLTALLSGCATLGTRKPNDDWSRLDRQMPKPTPEEPAPTLGPDAELQDYITFSEINNPALRAAFDRWRASLERIPAAQGLPDPRFTYGYYIREVETRVGPQQQTFGIAQTFPWFGKLDLKGQVALAEARMAEERLYQERLDLAYEVAQAYWDYYYLGRRIALTQEVLSLMEYLEQVARQAYGAGRAPHAAVIQAQLELGRLEDRLRSLKDLRRPATANLNAILNRPLDHTVPWPQTTPDSSEISVSTQTLRTRLLADNPKLRMLDRLLEKEDKTIALALKNYRPDLTLGLNYIQTNNARMRNVPESGKDPIIATLSLNLPIWTRQYRSEIAAAEARRDAIHSEKTNAENRLLAELEMALYEFRDARRKASLYENSLLPKAKQSLEVTRQAFQSAQADFLDLIDAQRILLEFELEREHSAAEAQKRLARTENLTGGAHPQDRAKAATGEENND